MNKDITELSWLNEKEKKRLDDPNLEKDQATKTMNLQTEANTVEIDIQIAKSRIAELTGKKEQTMKEINDILHEKRVVDKENAELQYKIDGRGHNEKV